MAYAFVRASNQYLSVASAPLTDYPFTMACWYKINSADLAINQTLLAIGSSTTNSRVAMTYNGGSTPRRAVQILSVSSSDVVSGTGQYEQTISSDTWNHAASVGNSSNIHTAYFNGLIGTSNVTTVSVSGIDRTFIGARFNPVTSAVANPLGGQMAEVGIWNTTLTNAEIASLAKGMTCNLVRPQSLVFYAPLIRDLQDVRGGRAITNNNTATVANHPRVYQ